MDVICFLRPSMRELLLHEFFAEDTGFKLELVNRDNLVESQESMVNFRLRITDQGKTRRAKPAHKENEAIEFEFNLFTLCGFGFRGTELAEACNFPH